MLLSYLRLRGICLSTGLLFSLGGVAPVLTGQVIKFEKDGSITVDAQGEDLKIIRGEDNITISPASSPTSISIRTGDTKVAVHVENEAKTGEAVATVDFEHSGGGKPNASLVNSERVEALSNFEVPSSPAAAALGVAPESIQTPSSPEGLIIGLIQGYDSLRNPGTGVAFDVAPFDLYYDSIDFKPRPEDYFERMLARTQFSIGGMSYDGDEDDLVDSSKIAASIRLGIFNSRGSGSEKVGDEKFANQNNLDLVRLHDGSLSRKALLKLFGSKRPFGQEARTFNEMISYLPKSLTENSSFDVGYASIWSDPTGELDQYGDQGDAVWAAYSYEPFSGFRMGLTGSYFTNESAKDKDSGEAFRQDRLDLGALMTYRNNGHNISLTGEYIELSATDAAKDDSYYRLTLSYEKQVAEELAVVFSAGTELDRNDGEQPYTFLANFKVPLGEVK